MPTIEEILALLQAKFAGARKDGLENLAGAIALQCSTKEEAQAIIDKLSDEKVKGFITDWRKKADAEISKATATHEKGLREKYDFSEKSAGGEGGGAGEGGGKGQPAGGELTLEAIGKLIDQRLEGVVTTFSAKEAAKGYRATFEQALDKAGVKGRYRDMMLRNFDRVNTFKTADEFNTYLTEAQGDIDAIKQEQADAGLGNQAKPLFGAVNKEGVSTAVADYLASQKSENTLSGKEI